MMAKYDPLRDYLRDRSANRIVLSFDQIEDIIGAALPPSARKYGEWWANEDPQRTMHVQAVAWQEAGWEMAGVDLLAEQVSFVRVGSVE